MYSYSIYIGLEAVPIPEHWGPSIYYLGTWTLRVQPRLAAWTLPVLQSFRSGAQGLWDSGFGLRAQGSGLEASIGFKVLGFRPRFRVF